MNAVAKQSLEIVEAKLADLLARATNDSIRTKLRNLHDVCKYLVVTGRQRLTVPAVVAAYAARFHLPEQSLAEPSIRNKRGGANPYQELYRAWESAAIVILGTREVPRTPVLHGEVLKPDDLAGIHDITLRHQVCLLIAQNRSLRNQVDILKAVRGAPVIQVIGGSMGSVPTPLANHLALNEAEVEAVKDFIDERKLKARRLRSLGDGGIEAVDGRRLADPGFVEALRKIVSSYRDPQ